MNSEELSKFEQELLEARAEILRSLNHFQEDSRLSLKDASGDIATFTEDHLLDTASETLGRETSFLLASAEGKRLKEIDIALRKFRNRKFGLCEKCGTSIHPERLAAIPFAKLCIQCQKQEESDHLR